MFSGCLCKFCLNLDGECQILEYAKLQVPLPSLRSRNFRKPRHRETKSQRASFLPNAKQYLAITCTAFYPQPEGPHTQSWRPELRLLCQRSRVADTHMAHSTRSFQTSLCRLGWTTLLARGKIIHTLCCFFPVTELIDLLRNLITISFHGEIQLQPLPP